MQFNLAGHSYQWIENWTTLPDSENGWAHHGLAILGGDVILTGHSTRPELYLLNQEGETHRSISLPVSELHHILVDESAEEPLVYLCDIGSKDLTEQYLSEPKVIAFNLQGEAVVEICKQHLEYEANQPFKPTSIAIDENMQTIWIADGYGSNLVHCVTKEGRRLITLDGIDGAGRFICPHCVFIDDRGETPILLISDRSNNRIQQYSLTGDYLGCLSIPSLKTPSAFCVLEQHLIVVELEARLHVLDTGNQQVATLFDGSDSVREAGWPNRMQNGVLRAPRKLGMGRLNSPHAICVDKDKNIYLSEWLIGGRFIKLQRCA